MLECIWPPAELFNPIILLHTYPSSQRNQSFSDKHCGFRIKLAHPLTNPVLDWRRSRNSQTRLSEQSKLRLKINFSWNSTLTFRTFLCIVVFYVDTVLQWCEAFLVHRHWTCASSYLQQIRVSALILSSRCCLAKKWRVFKNLHTVYCVCDNRMGQWLS